MLSIKKSHLTSEAVKPSGLVGSVALKQGVHCAVAEGSLETAESSKNPINTCIRDGENEERGLLVVILFIQRRVKGSRSARGRRNSSRKSYRSSTVGRSYHSRGSPLPLFHLGGKARPSCASRVAREIRTMSRVDPGLVISHEEEGRQSSVRPSSV